MNKETFLSKARNIHGYKYIYKNLSDKITLKDYIEIEHEGILYNQRVSKHLIGKCPEKNTPKKEKDQFIREAIEIWGDRFDYTDSVYINSNSKIRFFDKINNRFVEQIASLHIQGFEPKKIDEDFFILESELVSDFKYSYDKCEYVNKTSKVILCCKSHGEFKLKPFDHLNYGHICPDCDETFVKKLISKFLDKYKIHYQREYKFRDCRNKLPLPFDFYIPSARTCIEFDGIQHHQPIDHFGGIEVYEKLKENDKIKSEYCEENYINLIRIKWHQVDEIESILYENLKNTLKIKKTAY